MGLDPFRKGKASVLDVVVVAMFGLVTVGFVLWAFFG